MDPNKVRLWRCEVQGGTVVARQWPDGPVCRHCGTKLEPVKAPDPASSKGPGDDPRAVSDPRVRHGIDEAARRLSRPL